MKVVLAACAVAAMSFGSASAWASDVNSTVAGTKLTTAAANGTSTVVRRTVAEAPALDVIVDTFNSDPDYAYEPGTGWVVSAKGSQLGMRQDVAMPFTPQRDYVVKKINLAASLQLGTNFVTVTLNEDAGGLPGAPIRKATLADLQPFGECCTTVAIGGNGVQVSGGKQYWVVLGTNKKKGPDTLAVWNSNSLGLAGPFAAFHDGTGWYQDFGAVSAFSVLGR